MIAAASLLLSLAALQLLCAVVRPVAASARATLAVTPAASLAPFPRRDQAMAGKLAGSEDVTNFHMAYLGEIPVPAGSAGGGATYCFEESHFGGAGVGQCLPGASACCTTDATASAVKVTSIQVFLSTQCAVSMAKQLPGFKVTLTPMAALGQSANITRRTRAAASMNVRAGTATIRKSWKGAAELCVFVPEKRVNGPCGSMEKLCGPDGCAVIATTAPFKHSGAKKSTSCSLLADVPVASDACRASPCDPNANCTNFPVGSFTCACNDGYTGDGKACADVDECANSPCDANADCTNTNGSFSCKCKDGYTGDGKTCTDVDECANSPCDANADCTNTNGSYSCTCKAGFGGNGTVCTEICSSITVSTTGTDGVSASCTNGTITLSSAVPSLSIPATSTVSVITNAGYELVGQLLGAPRTDSCDANLYTQWTGFDAPGTATAVTTIAPNTCAAECAGAFHTTRVSLAAGQEFTCALLANTSLAVCFGANNYGQLGDGSTASRYQAAPVVGLSTGVSALAAGYYHACAIKTGGALVCWGYNAYGQLGSTDLTDQRTPVQAIGLESGVVAVGAGRHFTCALMSSGKVKCFGDNRWGQLGIDSTLTSTSTPTEVEGDYRSIAVGSNHVCAVTVGNTVSCWGAGGNGRLGLDSTSNQLRPTPVPSLQDGDVVEVTAGDGHTCARKHSGAVLCWGFGGYGQLGNGGTTDKLVPTPVLGFESGGAKSVFATAYSTFIVKSGDGSTVAFGRNDVSQLGIGSTVKPQPLPVPIPDLTTDNPATLIAGSIHTCAVRSSTGAIHCWGYNGQGQVGVPGLGTILTRPQDTSLVALPAVDDFFARVRAVGSNDTFAVRLELKTPAVCASQ